MDNQLKLFRKSDQMEVVLASCHLLVQTFETKGLYKVQDDQQIEVPEPSFTYICKKKTRKVERGTNLQTTKGRNNHAARLLD